MEELLHYIEEHTVHDEKLRSKFNEFLMLLGSYVKPSNLKDDLYKDPKKDEAQTNNFYYEREWRTSHEWKFELNDISAIMLPEEYIKEFKIEFSEKLDEISIFTTEMVEML